MDILLLIDDLGDEMLVHHGDLVPDDLRGRELCVLQWHRSSCDLRSFVSCDSSDETVLCRDEGLKFDDALNCAAFSGHVEETNVMHFRVVEQNCLG